MSSFRYMAWVLAPLLAACNLWGVPSNPDGWGRPEGYGNPVVAQTATSVAAFALADAVQAGDRGDLPGRARAGGLVDAGACREVGENRVYCNAVRVNDVQFDRSKDSLTGLPTIYVRVIFDEVRMCLGPGRAMGILIWGISSGAVLPSLLDEYPDEFAPTLASTSLVRRGDGSPPSRLVLNPHASLTALSVEETADRLRYGGPFPPEPEAQYGFRDGRPAHVYYPHAPSEAACRAL